MNKIIFPIIILIIIACYSIASAGPLENANQFLEKVANTASGWGKKVSNGVNDYIVIPVKKTFVRFPPSTNKKSALIDTAVYEVREEVK